MLLILFFKFNIISTSADTVEILANGCFLNNTEKCRLSEIPYGNSTQIFPGGDTGCSERGLYSFEARKGSPEHVLIFFQGGSTCWDQVTYDSGICRRYAKPYEAQGAFDTKNINNPFRNFTIYVVLYCTGDFFLGNNATSNMTNLNGDTIVYRGVQNAMTVLSHIVAEQNESDGYLAGSVLNYVCIYIILFH